MIRLNAYDNRLSVRINKENGSYNRALPDDCSNCDDPGTMEIYPDDIIGEWSYVGEPTCGSIPSFSDINDFFVNKWN